MQSKFWKCQKIIKKWRLILSNVLVFAKNTNATSLLLSVAVKNLQIINFHKAYSQYMYSTSIGRLEILLIMENNHMRYVLLFLSVWRNWFLKGYKTKEADANTKNTVWMRCWSIFIRRLRTVYDTETTNSKCASFVINFVSRF